MKLAKMKSRLYSVIGQGMVLFLLTGLRINIMYHIKIIFYSLSQNSTLNKYTKEIIEVAPIYYEKEIHPSFFSI